MPRLFFLIAFTMLLAGCASVQKPTAIIKGADITGLTADGFTVGVNLDVTNPNDVVIPLSGARYSVRVANVKLFEGVASPSAAIPAKGSAPVTLPIVFNFKDLLQAKEAIYKSEGNLNYDLKGALEFDDGSPLAMLTAKVPLEYAGSVDLKELLKDPQILLKSEAARELAKKLMGSLFGF